MNNLRDIEGLDAIAWWPPAPGWWLLAVLLVLLGRRLWKRWKARRDWRSHARAKLRILNRRLSKEGACDAEGCAVLTDLSMVLRRAAIARFGRRACAGLSGQAWLVFLAKHDPKGFDWVSEARLMVDLPYAPPGLSVDPVLVKELIRAARVWINKKGRAD